MSKRRKTICPVHQARMTCTGTRYGLRWDCPVEGCTVMCWGGATSTPADQETRDARRAAHAAFDPLWQGRRAPMSRSEAYRWLAYVLGCNQEQAHIGHLDADMARRVAAEATVAARHQRVGEENCDPHGARG